MKVLIGKELIKGIDESWNVAMDFTPDLHSSVINIPEEVMGEIDADGEFFIAKVTIDAYLGNLG